MSMPVTFDLCIVGAGMIGSASARHASLEPHTTVCLIGANEPEDKDTAEIFASHYDEARITRGVHSDPVWAMLDHRSVARYRQLETDTGIQFYSDVGCLSINGSNSATTGANKQGTNATRRVKVMPASVAKSQFPYITFDDHQVVTHESKDAGYINPRRMILAEQTAAQKKGCKIINDIVSQVTRKDVHVMDVTCEGGHVVHAHNVLLATGAFTCFRDLLPPGLIPDVTLLSRSIIYAEISDQQMADEYTRYMPTVVLEMLPGIHVDPHDATSRGDYMYSTPPVRHSDGRSYMKLGTGPPYEMVLDTNDDVTQWFRGEPPEHHKKGLKSVFQRCFPGIHPVSTSYATCVVSRTPTKRPFIDLVTSQLGMTSQIGLALGGNGYAANSSDELGRLAVRLLLRGHWDFPYPQRDFKITWKPPYNSKI